MVFDLNKVSKAYGNRWLFRNISIHVGSDYIWGIKGPNGSGKSTFLKILLDFVTPSKGQIRFEIDGNLLEQGRANELINFVAPYSSPPLDLKVYEFLQYHTGFRPFLDGVTSSEFLKEVKLIGHENKALRNLSTGMLQRLKLGLAFLTASEAILLDEPSSNLDEYYRDWFAELLNGMDKNRTLVIASNDEFDWRLTNRIIDLQNFQV